MCNPPPTNRNGKKCLQVYGYVPLQFIPLFDVTCWGNFIKSLLIIGNLSYLDNDLAPLPGIEKKRTSTSKIASRKNWAIHGIQKFLDLCETFNFVYVCS